MKRVFGRVYVYKNYVDSLPAKELSLFHQALKFCPKGFDWNIVNVDYQKQRVNFSQYSDFDKDEHPELQEFVLVDLKTGKVKRGKVSLTNPPILHRKETFVEPDYPFYEKFKKLTGQEEKFGLYQKKILNKIGFKKFWQELLASKGLVIENYTLKKAKRAKKQTTQPALFNLSKYFDATAIDTAKTAISRKQPSLPARIAVKKGLVHGKIFDWGCGKGEDIKYFKSCGFKTEGWDPTFKPETPPESFESGSFDWIHLGYVLNVIPERKARLKILKKVYNFLPKGGYLYLAVRSRQEINRLRKPSWKKCKDGWITGSKTFQKGYTLKDLKEEVFEAGFSKPRLITKKPVILLVQKTSQ